MVLSITLCLLAICMSSLENRLFRSSAFFDWVVFLVLSCVSCLYILEIILCQLFRLQLFSPILFVFSLLCYARFFSQVLLVFFLLTPTTLGGGSERILL